MPTKGKEKQENQHIQVAVRLRPINSSERKQASYSVVGANAEKKEVTVKERLGINPTTKTFNFDHVFTQDAQQQQVYKSIVGPIIAEVLSGYNCTIFAYGQTGTGKTFTMEGERSEDTNMSWEDDPLTGIIPRSLANIFDELQAIDGEYSVRVSFLELYNEELFDLLGSSIDPLRLKIYEDSARKGSVIIQGLEEIVVNSKDEVYEILERGASRRQTAATLMNAFSSRSHSVFTVTIHTKENTCEGEELLKTGKLHLVDLAGSENIGRSGAVDKRAREAGNINQSLLTLGRVITALVEHAPHIPYRESKLTRILQDSLGGRTKTSIIATISPASINLEETLSTLDYAHRAKNITNRPEVNQKLTKKALIKEYTDEIDKLRRDLQAAREKNGFFIAEDNYNSMQSRLTAQDDTILELMSRIQVMTEELNKIQDLFTKTEQELEQTTETLCITKEKLSKTKVTLRETKVTLKVTEQDRDGHKYLASELTKSEDALFDAAVHLQDTVEEATSEVTRLHDKVDRCKTVEEHNKQTLETFEDSFTSNVDGIQGRIQQYSSQQQEIYIQHKQHIEDKLARNSKHVEQLKSELGELQSRLKQHSATVNEHSQSSSKQSSDWVNSINDAASQKQREELEILRAIEGVITEKFGHIMAQVGTITTSMQQLTQLINTQHEEEKTRLTSWSGNLCTSLQKLENTVQTHATNQSDKITSLQGKISTLSQQYFSRQKTIQEKMDEITQLEQENLATVTDLSSTVNTETEDISGQTGRLMLSVTEQREGLETQTQSNLTEMLDIKTKQSQASQSEIAQVCTTCDAAHSDCTSLQSQLTSHVDTLVSSVDKYKEDTAHKCTHHLQLIDSQLHAHFKHIQTLEESADEQCGCVRENIETHGASVAGDVTIETSTLTTQRDRTAEMSETLKSRIDAHLQDMRQYIRDEIRENKPTGLTPVAHDFPKKRSIRRLSNQQNLIKKFKSENMLEIDEEIDSDIEQENVNQVEGEAVAEADGVQDGTDMKDEVDSDATSVKSSGYSESGFSAYSDASKKSEFKENDRAGRPLGSKKGKKNFNNVTPRKTRLPLRSATNSQTQN